MNVAGRIALIFFALQHVTEGYRILGLFPFEGRSHFVMGEALMKGLAEKGHEVVVVSHFPQKKKLKNYTDRSLAGSRPQIVNNLSLEFIKQYLDPITVYDFIFKTAGVELCDQAFQHPILQDLIHNNEKFDLLVTELWGTDCFLAFAHKFNIPHLEVTTIPSLSWSMARHGNPYNPSYVSPTYGFFKLSGMNFFERVANTLVVSAMNIGHYFYSHVPCEAIVKKYFGPSIPPLSEMINNSTLLLVNSHFSINYPVPLVPGVVEVGGLHISPSKPLPEEWKKLLDESENGVIMFSLGSLIKTESFDEKLVQNLVSAFRKLPQTIIWKFGGQVPNPPKNVRIVNWIPQTDMLAHPNVKMFITHGGLMGTQEALLAGVPLVGIPFFGDQRFNILNYVDMGIAVSLEFEEITEDTFLRAVRQILDNPSYAEKSKYYSELFKDRPQSALDTAIYWTEYVIRHKGAHHLKSSGTKLYWFQYLLLDVALFIIFTVLLTLVVIKRIIKLFFGILCKNPKKKLKKS